MSRLRWIPAVRRRRRARRAEPEPIRARTLTTLRWFALAGQTAAIVVGWRLGAEFLTGPAIAVIAVSALLNLWLTSRPRRARTMTEATGQLCFDAVQVGVVLALAGGIWNPFALFVLVPVTIAATVLPRRHFAVVASVTALSVAVMAMGYTPLRFHQAAPMSPLVILALGHLLALVVGGAFLAAYSHRVSAELAMMAEALSAAQMALSREQRLQHLSGVVAAAAHEMGTPLATIKLIASELRTALSAEAAARLDLRDDLDELSRQADRCRDILRSMGQAGKDDLLLQSAPVADVLTEAAAPHRDRGIDISVAADVPPRQAMLRDPALIYGLRNLIQNAVDFARLRVCLTARVVDDRLIVVIADDGPGFPPHLMTRLGEPFLTTRSAPVAGEGYEGMGLGLFIACALLARSGGRLQLKNDGGAVATVSWDTDSVLVDPRRALGPNPVLR